MFDFIEDAYNEPYFAIAAVITVAALVVTTMITLTKLRRGSLDGALSRHDNNRSETLGDANPISLSSDAVSNDKDDEFEGESIQPDVQSKGFAAPLSPRYPDPVDYCEHIQGEIKRVKQSVATQSIEAKLTDEQLGEERELQRRQLEEIFKLMQEQQDRFGVSSMDDMQEQMKLYAM